MLPTLAQLPDDEGRALIGMVARDGYQRWLSREVLAVLEGAFRELTHDVMTIAPTVKDRGRQALLWRQVGQRLSAAYGQVDQLTRDQMARYAAIEFDAARAEVAARVAGIRAGGQLAEVSATALLSNTVQAIAAFPIEGLPLGEWWNAQAASMSVATRRTLQIGMVKGETTSDLVARIIPPKDSTAPAVWRQAKAQATTLVQTATAAVQNDAAMRGYESAGPEVTEMYEYLAVRDARTTKICASLDGRRYRYDDPDRKVPPQHMNCRSTTIPVLNTKGIGIASIGKRSPLSYQSFDQWLRKQPKGVQNDVLGATRAGWYRNGKLSLEQLVDRDARVVPISELEKVLGQPRPPKRPRPPRPEGDSAPSTGAAVPSAPQSRAAAIASLRTDLGALATNAEVDVSSFSLGEVERAIAGLPLEQGILERNGQLVMHRTGDAGSVSMKPFITKTGALRDAVFTHNHPNNSPFSGADLMVAAGHGLAEIRAVTTGGVYSIRPGPSGWPTDWQAFGSAWERNLRETYRRLMFQLRYDRDGTPGYTVPSPAQWQALQEEAGRQAGAWAERRFGVIVRFLSLGER